MNHFSYEMMSKAKLKDLHEEGMRNQALHRSGARTPGLRTVLLRLTLALLGTSAVLEWLVH